MNKDSLTIQIPASSSNLGAGFDCFGLALDIHNKYSVEFIDDNNFEAKSNLSQDIFSLDKENLFYKSYKNLLEKNKLSTFPGVKLELDAQIPVAGGFGSSGTAVLAGLITANKVLGDKYSKHELIYEAALIEGHADNVCASMLGAFCLSKLEATKVVFKKIEWELDLLMLYPKDFRVNTDQARKALATEFSLEDCISNLSNSALFTAAVITKDNELLKEAILDKIHVEARQKLIPAAKEILEMANDHQALAATISGSGASLIVLLDSSTQINEIKTMAQKLWLEKGLESEAILTKVSNSGALIY